MRVISFWTRFHAPSSIRFSIVCHNHPQTHSSCNFRHDVSLYLSPSHSQFQWKNSQTLSVFSLVFSQNHQMEPCELSANTVIAHPRALTDKITLIRDAGPSKFQVFPTPISEVLFFSQCFNFVLCWSILGIL